MPLEIGLALVASVAALAVAGAALVLGRGRRGPGSPETAPLVAHLERLHEEIGRLGQAHEQLRRDVVRGREDSLRELADVAQGLQGRMASTQRDLAEVKALEGARSRQMDRAADSLRRLETVVAGSASRGAAGEGILGRALGQLPPDLLETNATFGGRVVEFALKLPDGRLLPIDSKWTSASQLEALEVTEDPGDRRRLLDQVSRDVRARIREMEKYLDPDRTLSLGLVAVPDAVHAAVPQAQVEGWRSGVLVVPYSLSLSFVLVLYRFAVRLGASPDREELGARLASLVEGLRSMDETVEGKLSRALVQLTNTRDDLRAGIARARTTTERLTSSASEGHAVSAGTFDPSSGHG